jgi:hypothetical protein
VYGTVTLAVTVTVNSGASHLKGNHLTLAAGTGSGSHGSANPRDYSGSDSVSWVRTLES